MEVIAAVEHAIVIAIWHMANSGAEYDDPGPDYYLAEIEDSNP